MHAWYGTSAWADATGTRRRLQALSAAGWSTSQLGELLGVSRSAIAQLRSTAQPRVLTSTAATVAALYDAHWWRTPPGRHQARCEQHAAQQGWVGPWRWDGLDIDDPAATPPPELLDQIDDVAIAELLAGRRVPLTRAERRTAVAELHRRGLTARQIADRVGVSDRTVLRYLAPGRAMTQQQRHVYAAGHGPPRRDTRLRAVTGQRPAGRAGSVLTAAEPAQLSATAARWAAP